MKKENEIKTTETKETKIENKLYDEYLNVWKDVKSALNGIKDKNIINNKKINNIIIDEIKKLKSLKELSGFKLFMSNNKPLAIYRDKNVFYTTIALGYIITQNEEFVDKISKCKIQTYKKENRIFIKIYDEKNNRKASDKRLFIFNFSSIEKLKNESKKIVKLTVKEKSSKKTKKKEKEFKTIEI